MQATRDNGDDGWRKTKLSLERPYKDENGNPIPTLLDIALDGQFVYEPREEPDAKFGEQFRRIFIERGIDFFDLDAEARYKSNGGEGTVNDDSGQQKLEEGGVNETKELEESHPMSPEELLKMRMELIPRLHIAYGEMSQARDLLSTLASGGLSGSASTPSLNVPTGNGGQIPGSSIAPGLLSASIVTPIPPITSVQAFDAQLVDGSKDEALRNASNVLQTAADGVERTADRSESYWADALRLRKANWSLVPAPLPMGASFGKGADKTSKDFLVSYGLESSPAIFRRQAFAHLAFFSEEDDRPLIFPHSNLLRMRVSLRRKDNDSNFITSHSSIRDNFADDLEGSIVRAQGEALDRETFAQLITEAANLPTASSRVSERLVAIEAAENVELRFELINLDESNEPEQSSSDATGHAMCDLIATSLPILLLKQHEHAKAAALRAGAKRSMDRIAPLPRMLQPIIDLLQYQVFLKRVRSELLHAAEKLREVDIAVGLRLEGSSDSVDVDTLLEGKDTIGGEALLRINERHTVRFTFASPSTLTAHLAQATVAVNSIPQLTQILIDEVERSLLSQICVIGRDWPTQGTWFVDEMMCRAVGRWEGCAVNFRVKCASDLSLDCHATTSHSKTLDEVMSTGGTTMAGSRPVPTAAQTFKKRNDRTLGFFAWVKSVISQITTDVSRQ